ADITRDGITSNADESHDLLEQLKILEKTSKITILDPDEKSRIDSLISTTKEQLRSNGTLMKRVFADFKSNAHGNVEGFISRHLGGDSDIAAKVLAKGAGLLTKGLFHLMPSFKQTDNTIALKKNLIDVAEKTFDNKTEFQKENARSDATISEPERVSSTDETGERHHVHEMVVDTLITKNVSGGSDPTSPLKENEIQEGVKEGTQDIASELETTNKDLMASEPTAVSRADEERWRKEMLEKKGSEGGSTILGKKSGFGDLLKGGVLGALLEGGISGLIKHSFGFIGEHISKMLGIKALGGLLRPIFSSFIGGAFGVILAAGAGAELGTLIGDELRKEIFNGPRTADFVGKFADTIMSSLLGDEGAKKRLANKKIEHEKYEKDTESSLAKNLGVTSLTQDQITANKSYNFATEDGDRPNAITNDDGGAVSREDYVKLSIKGKSLTPYQRLKDRIESTVEAPARLIKNMGYAKEGQSGNAINSAEGKYAHSDESPEKIDVNQNLIDQVMKGESKSGIAGYQDIYGGAKKYGTPEEMFHKHLTELTFAQVRQWQKA
ncbi:MAG TPA: hypothetical protein VIJ14_04290, partial [Rhabdochlamydiaceae bacterium]